MAHKLKNLGATMQAHLPGRSQSPHSTPRVEKDQLSFSATATGAPGTTAPPNTQGVQSQPGSKPRPARSGTGDNVAAGAHAQPGQPPQPTQPTQPPQSSHSAQPVQPAQPARPPRAAQPGQSGQSGQPPTSGPDQRKAFAEPPPPPRDREVPIHEREADPNKRRVDSNNNKREAELAEYELRRFEEHLKKRFTEIQNQEADIKDREARLIGQEAKLQCFESEPYRQELLSIRVHMQVNDPQEPWEITQRFAGITRKVEEISRNLGEQLFSSKPIRELTTGDFAKVLPHRHSSAGPTQPIPVDPEDFIDFACRALLNDWLVGNIFGPDIFHPAMNREENELFLKAYDRIRMQESQVIAGRWRVSTFKAFETQAFPFQEAALQFCEKALGPFCCYVYKPDAVQPAINSIFPAVKELFERALTWTHMAKSSVVMLDFHPDFFSPGAQYDDRYSTLEGPKPKPPASKTILLTTKLGLMSSRAVGESKKPEYSFQNKATVLAAEYFM